MPLGWLQGVAAGYKVQLHACPQHLGGAGVAVSSRGCRGALLLRRSLPSPCRCRLCCSLHAPRLHILPPPPCHVLPPCPRLSNLPPIPPSPPSRSEVLEGANELRIMLCRPKEASGERSSTSIVAACGIYMKVRLVEVSVRGEGPS